MPRQHKFRPKSVGPSFELRFNTTGSKFACCGRSVIVWDLASRSKVGKYHPFKHPSHIDWAPHENRLAVKNTAGDLVTINADDASGEATWVRKGRSEGCEAAFSPCGEYLVDCDWNGNLDVLNHRTGEIVLSESISRTMITALSYSRTRELYAYVVSPKATSPTLPPRPNYILVRRWPFWEHTAIRLPCHPQNVEAIVLSPDERRLLLAVTDLGCENARLQVCDIESGSIDAEIPYDFYASGRGVAWNPQNGMIANVETGGVRLYDSELRSSLAFLSVEYPSHVEFSGCGTHLGVGAWSKGFICSPEEALSSGDDDA